jgi:hypothetical protein
VEHDTITFWYRVEDFLTFLGATRARKLFAHHRALAQGLLIARILQLLKR